MDDELLTVKEVAARLKVNPQTVRRWIRSGRLPAVRVSTRGHRVRAVELLAFVHRPPEPTAEELARHAEAVAGVREISERIVHYAGPSLQDIIDESKSEGDLRGALVGWPPPVTPEQLRRRAIAIERLRSLRSAFAGRGPSLQEILDAEREARDG